MLQDFTDPPAADTRRLAALRAALRDKKIDAFLVPRADEYQGEYVPPAAARLQWLTGFSGSAGLFILLAKRAALFVDGRYTLQAAQEVDSEAIEIVPSATVSPTQWLAKHIKKSMRVGIDPRLHCVAEFGRFANIIDKQGGALIRLQPNPIDAIWQDRPPAPATPIEIQPDALTGRASSDKRAALAKQLRADKQAAMLIAQPENIAWLLNIRAQDVPHTPFALSYALLNSDASCDWFIDAARCDAKAHAHLGNEVRLHPPAMLGDFLGKLEGVTRYAPETTPQFLCDLLDKPHAATDLCALPKACKTAAEIAGAEAAHRRDGVALCRFLHWLDTQAPAENISEISAAKYLETMRAENPALRDLSFDTIAGSGPNGAIIHYRVTEKTDRRLEEGDLFLVDSGGQYADGTTDVTRTVLIGDRPAPPHIRAYFTRVLKGHLALANARFPHGTSGAQLDPLARAPLWAAGLDFDHGTGHGVGSYLSVHEGPQRIAKGGDIALQPGMIVSNEPGYYRADAFGIRIENLQYVTPPKKRAGESRAMLGFAPLTRAPIDRRLIELSLLSQNEIAQLNAYHADVLAVLADELPSASAEWLARQCAPLA